MIFENIYYNLLWLFWPRSVVPRAARNRTVNGYTIVNPMGRYYKSKIRIYIRQL